MNYQELTQLIQQKNSLLCVGLDTDLQRIPDFLKREKDPIFEFNRRIIDQTAEYAVAYKPNIAFYESLGSYGWEALQKTVEYIPDGIFTIADAKRGDIGNTSSLYARAFFENLSFDSITVAPYMGSDSVQPFLKYEDKWVILLVHTSNQGSADFQLFQNENGTKLYEEVIRKAKEWGSMENMMFVVGATRGESIGHIRKLAPDHFFLVPGIGAQGGDLEEVCKYGMNSAGGLLINSSRGIIYASGDRDFDQVAGKKSLELKEETEKLLNKYAF